MEKYLNLDSGKKRATLELCHLWTYQCPSVWMTSDTNFPKMSYLVFWNCTNTNLITLQLLMYCSSSKTSAWGSRTLQTCVFHLPSPLKSPCCEWQGPCWPERQAAICKLPAQGCYQSVANQQVNCQTAGWGQRHCSRIMKVVYPLIISSKNIHEITAGLYRKSL